MGNTFRRQLLLITRQSIGSAVTKEQQSWLDTIKAPGSISTRAVKSRFRTTNLQAPKAKARAAADSAQQDQKTVKVHRVGDPDLQVARKAAI
jgi:hypothetical protein